MPGKTFCYFFKYVLIPYLEHALSKRQGGSYLGVQGGQLPRSQELFEESSRLFLAWIYISSGRLVNAFLYKIVLSDITIICLSVAILHTLCGTDSSFALALPSQYIFGKIDFLKGQPHGLKLKEF